VDNKKSTTGKEMKIDLIEPLSKISIVRQCAEIFKQLDEMSLQDKIEAINEIRFDLLKYSPFKNEPVDFVRWISSDLVNANDYNPNSVAPPEMKLLEHSITEDGYTQPIVSWSRDGVYEVVDGFHRHRVGKESNTVRARVHGYLPAVVINDNRQNKNDRMASTIRHNRARGEHKVESMSEIVVELKRRFWSDEKIAKELGMDSDEVLRLQQVTGLSGLFTDAEFSEAWEAETFEEIEGVDEPLL
jgi:ParB-like chromosome segregation protein Spo0J